MLLLFQPHKNIYIQGPILKFTLDYIFRKAFKEKMFKKIVVWVGGGHELVPLTLTLTSVVKVIWGKTFFFE